MVGEGTWHQATARAASRGDLASRRAKQNCDLRGKEAKAQAGGNGGQNPFYTSS